MIIKRPLYRIREPGNVPVTAGDAMRVWNLLRTDLAFLLDWSPERRQNEKEVIAAWLATECGDFDSVIGDFMHATGLISAAITLALSGQPVGKALLSKAEKDITDAAKIISGALNDALRADELAEIYGADLRGAPETWHELFICELGLTGSATLHDIFQMARE